MVDGMEVMDSALMRAVPCIRQLCIQSSEILDVFNSVFPFLQLARLEQTRLHFYDQGGIRNQYLTALMYIQLLFVILRRVPFYI